MLHLTINRWMLFVAVLLVALVAAQALWGQSGLTVDSKNLPGYEIVVAETESDEEDYKEITVSCPEGKILTGGGAAVFHNSTSNPDGIPRLVSSFIYPDPTTWYAEAAQLEDAEGEWSLQVQAICVKQ